MKYKYRIKRPSKSACNPGDFIIERDESKSGAISLLKWLQAKFGEDDVTLWKVSNHTSLEQVK